MAYQVIYELTPAHLHSLMLLHFSDYIILFFTYISHMYALQIQFPLSLIHFSTRLPVKSLLTLPDSALTLPPL